MATTRVQPWDLLEVKNDYGDVTISQAIAAIQAADNRVWDCPKCLEQGLEVNPQPTGRISQRLSTGDTTTVTCDICSGYLKTAQQYVADPDNPGQYIPYQEQPTVFLEMPEEQEPESQGPQ